MSKIQNDNAGRKLKLSQCLGENNLVKLIRKFLMYDYLWKENDKKSKLRFMHGNVLF